MAEERCVPLVNDDGEVVARVRVTGEMDDETRRHLLAIVEAAQRLDEKRAKADPTRGERQAESIRRIRERARRYLGGAS